MSGIMELQRWAYAKINLGLDVTGRRPDGYHEVRMIMQTISLHDTVRLVKTAEPGIALEVLGSELPADEHNLAYRAAKLLMDEFHPEEGVKISLVKRIPMAAGLAGGSADCAAVMTGMNDLFGFGLTGEELRARGVKIGADVPYCILGGTALAEGIGEVLTVLPAMPACFVVTAKPPVDVPTGKVYKDLDSCPDPVHPEIDRQLDFLAAGNLAGVAAVMGNTLASVTEPKVPVITELKNRMLADGAVNAMMSGSGPTVFGLFTDRAAAESCAGHIAAEMPEVQTAVSVPV